jgi:hypothetical protein
MKLIIKNDLFNIILIISINFANNNKNINLFNRFHIAIKNTLNIYLLFI